MLPGAGDGGPEMLMTVQLQRPADSNREIRIVLALPRHSAGNPAILIVPALWPIRSPAEKGKVRKGSRGKVNPAEADKASRRNHEAQRQTPLNVQGNNRAPSRATVRKVAAVARNKTIRAAGAAAREQPINGAAWIRPGR